MADILWSEIAKSAKKNIAALVFNCELNFDHQIYDIAHQVFDDKRIKLILLAGPSASGKTTSCDLMADRLEYLGVKTHRISTDDFFLNREDTPRLPSGLPDFDSPNAINIYALQQSLARLVKGESVQLPRFDFLQGRSYPDGRIVEMNGANDIIVLEGIHALNPLMLAGFDYAPEEIRRISIAPRRNFKMESGRVLTPNELRLIRRTIRDHYTRGNNPDQTAKQWVEVLKAEKEYIYPYFEDVDWRIDSIHEYELILYKLCLGDILDNVHSETYDNIRHVLDEVVTMPISSIPTTSLLNEFTKFGVFAD